MGELKKNLQIMYFVLNGFALSILLLLWGFERPGGFLHYSPGKWLDLTLLVFLIVFAIIVPFLSPELIGSFEKSDEEKLKLALIVRIVSGWFAFGLMLLCFLYQTEMWLRYASIAMTLFVLWLSYPTQSKIERLQAKL